MTGHRFNPKKADKLIDPKREKLLNPQKVLDLLDVNQGETVVDLGAGNGFFTLPIAKRTNETVYAIDIEPQMLELLKERSQLSEVKDIKTVVSDIEEIKLENSIADKVIVAFVLHEVPNLEKVLNEIKRISKPNFSLLILEWEAIESEVGPPLHDRIASKELANVVESSGYEVSVSHLDESIYALLCSPK